jgi:hypothetical protein
MIIDVVKKPIDWLQLQRAFGVREIDNCMVWSGDTKYELGNLLKDQLDQLCSKFETPGFSFDPVKSGRKKTYDVLKIYLNKIGVSI